MVKNGSRSIISQLSGRINGLKKLQQADFKYKLAVATAVIQSKIQYLLPLYGGAPDYLMRAIQVQQLKAAIFVCGYNSFYWSTHKLLKTCGRLSIKQQEFYSSTLLAHKIVITSLPRNLWADKVQQPGQQLRDRSDILTTIGGHLSFQGAVSNTEHSVTTTEYLQI